MKTDTPLSRAMLQIKMAPRCSVCGGTGLTVDELHECGACSGYGRGEGIFARMIEDVSRETKAKRIGDEQANEPPAPLRIHDYMGRS